MKKRSAQPPTKTFRFRLEKRPQSDVWFGETQVIFNKVAAFYFEVIEAHPGIMELSDQPALTALEQLTHATKHNPRPSMPLADAVPPEIPSMFRRAAIRAALGSARSFHSKLDRWREQKAKAYEKAWPNGQDKIGLGKAFRFHDRPPVPPREWNKSTVLYDGMWKEFDGHKVMLKVWTGSSWAWVKFQVTGRKIPEGWSLGSPQIVRRGGGWNLHIPATREAFRYPAKVREQLADANKPRLCAVDLNINDDLAVCTIQKADGAVVATRFIRGGRELQHRRKRALGRVARNRSLTGAIQKYETDNVRLFRKIRAMDEGTAHQVSRRIVQFALKHGASILVFEHLGNFKPEKGKYSKRGNEKRSSWLRGKIFRFTQYKAWEEGLITCRVNPRDTSRLCASCHEPVARYNAGGATIGYSPGAPLFVCHNCLARGNADRNAGINIGHKLIERYQAYSEKPQPVSSKQGPRGQGVVSSHGIPVNVSTFAGQREQGKPAMSARPSSTGADDGVGTAQEKRTGKNVSSRRTTRPALRPQRSRGYAAPSPKTANAGMPEEAAPLQSGRGVSHQSTSWAHPRRCSALPQWP
jgi:putative transposase